MHRLCWRVFRVLTDRKHHTTGVLSSRRRRRLKLGVLRWLLFQRSNELIVKLRREKNSLIRDESDIGNNTETTEYGGVYIDSTVKFGN